MIRYLLAVLAAVLLVTSEAAAIECSAERLQSGKGHWSWRIVDGKKCWYPGRPGVSKDNLHWPSKTEGQKTVGQRVERLLPLPRLPSRKSGATSSHPTLQNPRSPMGT